MSSDIGLPAIAVAGQIVYISLLGILIGWIYLKSGSIWPVDGARTSRVGLDELPRLSPAARSRAELDRGCQAARSAGGSR